MIPICFTQYYQKRAQDLVKHFRMCKNFAGVDPVHDVRVEIKRLRAFYHLVEWINPSFPADHVFKPVQRFFKAAGSIRDIHVQQQVIHQSISKGGLNLSEYYNRLRAEEQRQHPAFRKACNAFDIIVLTEGYKAIAAALEHIAEEEIVGKLDQKITNVMQDILKLAGEDLPAEDNLHQVRILSKEARYVLEVLRECRGDDEHRDALNIRLRDVHRALGQWHDCDIALDSLGEFLTNHSVKPQFDSGAYDRLAAGLSETKDVHRREFVERWHDLKPLLSEWGAAVEQNSKNKIQL